MSSRHPVITEPPERVVAVISAKARKGFPYLVAAVYELKPRKGDGVLTYRKSDAVYAQPHRSERLAVNDAEVIAAKLGVPFWRFVRHGTTGEAAMAQQRKFELRDRAIEMTP